MMELKEFAYDLPEALIAQKPLAKRDQSQLLIIHRKSRQFNFDIFSNVGDYLPKKSLIVFNNSKVIPARLYGRKKSGTGKVEIFLLKALSDYTYEVLMRPMKRLKDGDEIEIENSTLVAAIVDKDKKIVRFNRKQLNLEKIGHMPLPPYIKRSATSEDKIDYQTVYAKKKGSVAAPTAGLHFTKSLISKLQSQEHQTAEVTLHVNYATFKPVEEEYIENHQMHFEDYSLSRDSFKMIKDQKKKNQKIVAVGTTSCRVLESLARSKNLSGSTNLFIYPGYQFQYVDTLITNFHLPYSTLLMLVSAFSSRDLIFKAYEEAKNRNFRFFSYGDAMLII